MHKIKSSAHEKTKVKQAKTRNKRYCNSLRCLKTWQPESRCVGSAVVGSSKLRTTQGGAGTPID